MDLKTVARQDQEEEIRVKTLLEVSTKKYNLRKALESLKLKLSAKERDLQMLRKQVVALQLEVPVLEKQKEIAKKTAEDSFGVFLDESQQVEKIQENVWDKINSFILESNARITKNAIHPESRRNPKKDREERIQQLKLEGEVEAMGMYGKYQYARMEELKLVKDLLEDDSFVI